MQPETLRLTFYILIAGEELPMAVKQKSAPTSMVSLQSSETGNGSATSDRDVQTATTLRESPSVLLRKCYLICTVNRLLSTYHVPCVSCFR